MSGLLRTATVPSAATAASRRWWALGVVVAAQFMFVVDAFVVNVAIPSIRRDLGATAGEMEAVLALYQIAYAACVITGSRLGDIYGRRRVFLTGVLTFTATSVWCGLAGSGATPCRGFIPTTSPAANATRKPMVITLLVMPAHHPSPADRSSRVRSWVWSQVPVAPS